jgi:cysteine-rich repeat protein
MRGFVLATILALPALGCGSSLMFEGGDADAGPDTHHDAAPDTAPDTRVDTAVDPEPDVEPDGPTSECGNGATEAGEDCDDGNGTDGDGCDTDCTWSCTRNWECADEDHCTSDVCEMSTHTCSHGTLDCTDTDECTIDGCNPASGCTHERMPNWYRDEDTDGYGDHGDVRCANTAPEGYVDNDDDCCDTDGDIHPGVTSWFTERSYCTSTYGNFDYNCDGTDERHWSGIGSCADTGGSCVLTAGWESSTSGPPCGYTWNWLTACTRDSTTGTCLATMVERTQECR